MSQADLSIHNNVEPAIVMGIRDIVQEIETDIENVSAQTIESFSHVYEDLGDLETNLKDLLNNLDTNTTLAVEELTNRVRKGFENVRRDVKTLDKECLLHRAQLLQVCGGETTRSILNIPQESPRVQVTAIQWGTLQTYTHKKFNRFHCWILRVLLGMNIRRTYI